MMDEYEMCFYEVRQWSTLHLSSFTLRASMGLELTLSDRRHMQTYIHTDIATPCALLQSKLQTRIKKIHL